MTKISSKTAYPKKKPISSDYFVGTDSEDFNKTVNFGFEEVAGLVNKLNGTPLLNYLFSTSPYLSTEVLLEGRFLSDENELSTPSLTKLYINKFNNSGDNLQELYLFLQANATDFYLKLRNSNNQNNAVYFDIASIEDFPDYFILNITVFKENEFLPLLENLNVYFFDFELKATSAGTSDPLKLDKDGYTGTAKDIDDRILVLENQTDVDNAFITKPTFSLSANTLTIDALGKWKLEGVIYENPASVAFPITLCTAGKTRLDYFVPNNANGFTKVSGIETLGLAIAPQLPNENIYVTYVLVTDSGVGEPVIPPAVVTPNLQQVLESGFSTTKRIWFWNTLNSKCTRFASDHILFQKLESVFNFIRADNTTQSYNIQLPNKIGGAEQTFAMVSDLTKSQVGLSNVDNTSDATKPVSGPQQTALDSKLDASAYNEYFKGKYTSSGALTTAHPTATDGDYAIVDSGTGVDAKEWIWDNEAGWIVGGATGASTTDALPEGSTNLYWTVARFLANLTAVNIKAALGFTPENVANKSDSYTASSSTTYASTKAIVDGLGTKQNTLTNPITGTGSNTYLAKFTGTNSQASSVLQDTGTSIYAFYSTPFNFSAIPSAAINFGNIGVGGSLIVQTPSLNASYGSGFAVDGTYLSGKSVINISAFGAASGGPYSADMAFKTSTNTTLSEKMRLTNTGNLLIGTTVNNGVDKLQVNGTISSTGNITALSYNGNGNGLTGIAPSLSIGGNATTATNVAWLGITSKPTTVTGYGITDAVTTNTSQTITASKVFEGNDANLIFNNVSDGGVSITANLTATAVDPIGLVVNNDNLTGTGIFIDNKSTGIFIDNKSTGIFIDNKSTSVGSYLFNRTTGVLNCWNAETASTGDLLQFTKNDVLTGKIDHLGNITALSFIKSGASANDILLGNGTTSSLSAKANTVSPTFTGTPTAPTATVGTNTTQIATTAFVQGIKPYKVYTALLSQSGTSAPTATVLENTLGGTITWTRVNPGLYSGTLTGAFTTDKTILLNNNPVGGVFTNIFSSVNTITIQTRNSSNAQTDDGLSNTSIEIRVYN